MAGGARGNGPAVKVSLSDLAEEQPDDHTVSARRSARRERTAGNAIMQPVVMALKRSEALRAASRKGELYLLNRIETLYDLRYNIRTRSDDLDPAFGDDEGYDPISYPGLDYIRKQVGFLPGEVFVDIGCGRGRALCVFSRDPAVSHCVGIEYHSEHAQIARRNAQNVRAKVANPVRQSEIRERPGRAAMADQDRIVRHSEPHPPVAAVFSLAF
jgi:hypothetical protein